MNDLRIPKYHLIGHRGVAGLRPENTLCSFEYAAQLGLDWIEFDTQLTVDDRWVVMHDDALDRTTTGRGFVSKWTSDDVCNLEAGLWFKPPFPNQKVPSLLQVLELAQQHNLFCDVEIKGADFDPAKNTSLFAEFITEYSQFSDMILVTSFNIDCLIELRIALPNLKIGINIDIFSPNTIEIVRRYNFANINCDVKNITVTDLQAAKQANIPVFLFTINDPTTAKYWLDRGVSAVFSDRPDLLL